MPILRGLMPLKINDYRKHRKIKENRKTPTQNGHLLNIKQNASFIGNLRRIIMYIKENSPVKDSNMNYQEQKYYQQGKIDGIREFVRELKKHSCSYDLEEWMNFDAVNVEVIDTLMNDCINKILAEITASEE